MNDGRLIREITNDNIKAFDALFLKYYQPLCRFARMIIKDNEASEEIVQELFINLWEQRKDIVIQTSVSSYLYTAARNRSINHLNKVLTRKLHEESYANSRTGHHSDPDDTLSLEEIHLNLAKAIEELPDKCKEIFILSRNHHLSHAEISAQLKISVKTVENQITIALKKLRSALAEYLNTVVLFIQLFI